MEHRWGQRREVRTRVLIRAHGGLEAVGFTDDVSISGALIETALPAALLSHVKIYLSDGRRSVRTSVSIEGQVVRRTAQGFAVEWVEFAPDAIRALTEPTEFDVSIPASRAIGV